MTGGTEPAASADRRIIPLEGGHNFRDLGGYRTVDGRYVRWRRIFRSGAMNKLTPNDHRLLANIGIRTVCDLRSNRERAAMPAALPDSMGVDYWARDYEGSSGDLLTQIGRVGTTAEQMTERMLSAYRRLPYEQAPAYRELFHRIASGRLPLIFNCVAGKDRTGIAAALLLAALGVPRETIIADYIVTERFFDRLCDSLLGRAAGRLSDVAPSVWAPVLRTDPAYLKTMFDEIERRDGSVEVYLANSLEMDLRLQAQLRSQLLEHEPV